MAAIEVLKSLHAKLIDARKGYETARQETEAPKMRQLFDDMILLHEQFHGDIHGILRARNVEPNDEGTLLSAVHKAVISVRSAVTGLDEDSLSGFADGEERILKIYDQAIDETSDDKSAASILRRHRERLRGVIEEMRSASS